MSASPSAALRHETFDRTSLLSTLTPAERQQIAALAVEKSYAAGAVLFHEGTPCEGLYVIGSGTVKISKTSASGREIMLAVESAPSSVAEVPLFDQGDYPATVTALVDSVAFLVRKEDFRLFCRQHPEVPLKVLAVVGRRLRQLVGLIEAVTFGSVRQRLARLLLETAVGADPAHVPLTHEELALRLGTVREVVSRNLARFQAEGAPAHGQAPDRNRRPIRPARRSRHRILIPVSPQPACLRSDRSHAGATGPGLCPGQWRRLRSLSLVESVLSFPSDRDSTMSNERGTPLGEPISGYSSQAQISLDIASTINHGRLRIWFASQFNAIENPERSNPLRIFEELDRANKSHSDAGKPSSTRVELEAWITKWYGENKIGDQAYGKAIDILGEALLKGRYEPVVLYLDGVDGAEKMQFADEYLLPDARLGEAGVRQLLPPPSTEASPPEHLTRHAPSRQAC